MLIQYGNIKQRSQRMEEICRQKIRPENESSTREVTVPPEKTKLTDGTLKHGKQKGKEITLKYTAQSVGTLTTNGSEIHR